MSEPTQAVDWEKRYRDEQAELTRLQQAQAEWKKQEAEYRTLQERLTAGALVEKEAYDKQWIEHVRSTARENPDAFLQSVGVDRRETSSANRNGSDSVLSGYPGFDDSVFDENSDSHRRFVSEYGQRGYDDLRVAQLAPKLIRAAGLDKKIDELSEKLTGAMQLNAELQEQVTNGRQYAEQAWWQTRVAGDPLLKRVQDEQERAKADPEKWWREYAAARDELEQLKSKPAPPSGNGQQTTSAADQAARIQDAQSAPVGAGAASGSQASRSGDPLEDAIQRALSRTAR